jgi:hypothetical protein
MFEQLEKARTNTVAKILDSTAFKLLLVECGWQGLPPKFLKTVASSAETPVPVLLQVIPLLSVELKEEVARHGKHPLFGLCLLWPEFVQRWQPWTYATLEEAWIALQDNPHAWLDTRAEPLATEAEQDDFRTKRIYVDDHNLTSRYVGRVCDNPLFDHRLHGVLLRHPHAEMRRLALCMGKGLSDEARQLALHDPSPQVRSQLARQCPNDDELMMVLARDEDMAVRIQVAYAHCSPEVLHGLSDTMDVHLLHILAFNPRLSAATVEKLCAHPYALRQAMLDEAFGADARTAPDPAVAWQAWLKRMMHTCPQLQASIRDKFSSVSEHLMHFNAHLAKHSCTPQALLEEYAASPLDFLRREAAANPSLPASAVQRLRDDPDDEVRLRVLKRSDLGSTLGGDEFENQLRVAACSSDSSERAQVASCETCPLDLLQALARDEDSWVRRMVACNPATPVDLLRQLCDADDSFVLSSLAENLLSPPDVLERLLTHPDYFARYSLVVYRNNTPVEMLQRLVNDKSLDVRRALLEHGRCTPGMLDVLVNDKSVQVRRLVATNPHASDAILERLSVDPDGKTARAAGRALKARRRQAKSKAK